MITPRQIYTSSLPVYSHRKVSATIATHLKPQVEALSAGSLEVLPDLFSTEGADAIEPKTKYQAVFLSDANVERVVLRGHRAAIPGIAQRHGRADEGSTIGSRSILKIEEERCAAKKSILSVAQKD